MALPRLAVIQFPGSNCEYETRRRLRIIALMRRLFDGMIPRPSVTMMPIFCLVDLVTRTGSEQEQFRLNCL